MLIKEITDIDRQKSVNFQAYINEEFILLEKIKFSQLLRKYPDLYVLNIDRSSERILITADSTIPVEPFNDKNEVNSTEPVNIND